jgi:hypothetical protein
MKLRLKKNNDTRLGELEEEIKDFLTDYPIAATAGLFALGAVFTSFIYDTTPETEQRMLETLAQFNGTITETQFQKIIVYDPVIEALMFSLGLVTVMITIYYRKDIVRGVKGTYNWLLQRLDYVWLATVLFIVFVELANRSPYVNSNSPFLAATILSGMTVGIASLIRDFVEDRLESGEINE